MVGGGFSGTLLAVQLLRRGPSLSIAVVDKGQVPGRGLAYGTRYPCHLLNVPACNMSALPEEPDHFLQWAKANYGRTVQATTFLPRAVYGRYVGSLLEEATGHGCADRLQWIHGEVLSISHEQTGMEVQLADSSTLIAQTLVLSIGNFSPGNSNIPGLGANSMRYVRSLWSATAWRDIPKDGNVLLIGFGLTSIDLAVAIKSEGFAGHIHILSRHGLMPQALSGRRNGGRRQSRRTGTEMPVSIDLSLWVDRDYKEILNVNHRQLNILQQPLAIARHLGRDRRAFGGFGCEARRS